jgi:hypothetical protein
MAMVHESYTSSAGASVPPPDYNVLDFNAPATIGIVLYENQVTRGILRGEIANSEKGIRADLTTFERSIREGMSDMERSIRADMIAMERSLREGMSDMERSIRADMIAMERSLREEIGRSTKNLILLMVSLHGVSLSVVAALITLN